MGLIVIGVILRFGHREGGDLILQIREFKEKLEDDLLFSQNFDFSTFAFKETSQKNSLEELFIRIKILSNTADFTSHGGQTLMVAERFKSSTWFKQSSSSSVLLRPFMFTYVKC